MKWIKRSGNQYIRQRTIFGLNLSTWSGILIILTLVLMALRGNALANYVPNLLSPAPSGFPAVETTFSLPENVKIKNYIFEVFGGEVPTAIRIAECESHFKTNAVNTNWTAVWGVYWSKDWGIFQINDKSHGFTELAAQQFLTDPYVNIRVAKKIFDSSGWGAWACAKFLGI